MMKNVVVTRILAMGALVLVAACVEAPGTTPDAISYDYDPRFRTKFMIRQSAVAHCGRGKAALLVSDQVKNDNTGDRIATFKCVSA